MNAHTSTFGNQQDIPELPALVFQILSNMYDCKDQLSFEPKETYESLLGCAFHQKLSEAADRKYQLAMAEMRMGIHVALADAGYGFSPFGSEAVFSILFNPRSLLPYTNCLRMTNPWKEWMDLMLSSGDQVHGCSFSSCLLPCTTNRTLILWVSLSVALGKLGRVKTS